MSVTIAETKQPVAETRTCAGTVCHLVHSLGVGGAEVLVADMVRSLSGRFRSVVACLDAIGRIGESLASDGVPLQLLDREPGIDWRCSRRLAAWCRENSVDMIHAHQCTPMFQAMLARLPWKRMPILLTEHGRHYPDLPNRRRALCHRLLLSRRDRLVAVGESTRQALIANEGLPAARVEVVYNGVDLQPYHDVDPELRRQVRSELGLDRDDLVLCLVARMDAIKDHFTALETLTRVRRSLPNARLLLAGEGPHRGAIEARVRELGLTQHARLLGVRRDIPRVLAAADVFLMTSLGEGIPLTIIEAMAAGVPVVSTNVGGIPEMISDGETGLLHSAGDADGLAQSVLRLHTDSELREQMINRARVCAFSRFSRERMLSRYANLYQEMLRDCRR